MGRFLIKQQDLVFIFLNSGDLYEIRHGNIMLNQLRGNQRDGSLNNLYLRIWRDGHPDVYPLLGVKSASAVERLESGVRYTGQLEDLSYTVDFHLTGENLWFWDVQVQGQGEEVDLVYGQDLGLANQGALLNNEAYVAQYVDHAVFEDPEQGYVVCSRQNQFQGSFPYLQQGGLTKTVGYSTDGFQFFGLDYKETNKPQALFRESLVNEVYQYEFAYTALQSERVSLDGRARFVFYGLFIPDHPEAVLKPDDLDEVERIWLHVSQLAPKSGEQVSKPSLGRQKQAVLGTLDLSGAELEQLYPVRLHEEWQGDTLLSFFTPEHHHVVLKAKELLVERPHGHILMSGEIDRMTTTTITTTSFMFGIFNAQLSIGNTSFNRLFSNNRNQLNVSKVSGQRLYVEISGEWRLLTMPSAFEMGFNYARWYYRTGNETFVITNYTVLDAPEVRLVVRSLSGQTYRYRITNQVIMDQVEYNSPFTVQEKGQNLVFRAGENALNARVEPDLAYVLHLVEDFSWSREDETSLVILDLVATSSVNLTIKGYLESGEAWEDFSPRDRDFYTEVQSYNRFFERLMQGFSLELPGETPSQLSKLNTLAWWYTHNMLVHFSVPRGLEQSSGGGWGTRDVCQGPAEYFLATCNYQTVREIIHTVYSHQFMEDGSWPQWFMFDGYYHIQAGESHGDIIVWPLKLVSDYLRASGDYAILQENIPYTWRGTKEFTTEWFTLLEHVQKQITYIEDNFLPGTHLSAYGDGDWDDTLQPANKQLRQHMVSSWTVALTYQAFNQLAKALAEDQPEFAAKLAHLASQVEEDFKKYVLPTGVIPGFVYLENLASPEFMLHPADTKTGIHYRLLPQTRSIISELVDLEQAQKNVDLIKQHLCFPDGVRLMNRPATYRGGVSEHFQRAEQAANFGREIGLQYVHAHIRFVEAMAKLGRAEDVWWALGAINPIKLKDVVPNAELRQSNAYFSSSDGKFNTRYSAARDFHKLKEGQVGVKGGWRIYSSGPGIYFNQLVSNCLGIRPQRDALIIDPVLPWEYDGLRFTYASFGRPIQFVFYLAGNGQGVRVNGQRIASEPLNNRYRPAGYVIKRENLEELFVAGQNTIEVFLRRG